MNQVIRIDWCVLSRGLFSIDSSCLCFDEISSREIMAKGHKNLYTFGEETVTVDDKTFNEVKKKKIVWL